MNGYFVQVILCSPHEYNFIFFGGVHPIRRFHVYRVLHFIVILTR